MVKWNKHNRIQLQRVADTGNTTKIPTKTKAMVLAGLGRPKWEHRWCFWGGARQANGGPRSGHLQHGLCAGRWTMLFALNEALRPTWPCALALHQRYDLQLCSLNIKWMNKICGRPDCCCCSHSRYCFTFLVSERKQFNFFGAFFSGRAKNVPLQTLVRIGKPKQFCARYWLFNNLFN